MKNVDTHSLSEIVIFGALGDLSRRKLLHALYQFDGERRTELPMSLPKKRKSGSNGANGSK